MSKGCNLLVVIAAIIAIVLSITGCGKSLDEKIPDSFINETLEFALTDPMPVPSAKESSTRGEAIENLVTVYATSYESDKYLAEQVKMFRQWRWEELYTSLAQKAQENPGHLNTYRLQAEVYLTNSKYNEALAALDNILRVNHDDIYALGLSAYVKHFMGNEEQSEQRLLALKNVSEECYQDLVSLMEKVDTWRSEEHGNGLENTENLPYDAIALLGVSPTASGELTASAVLRLKEAVKAAYFCPDAKIIISGGPVDYEFAEATVMKEYLLKNSTDLAIGLGLEPEGSTWEIAEDRILLDLEARDTVGNAIGIFKHIDEYGFDNLLIVASAGQVMRADCIFKAYAEANHYDIIIHSASSGNVEAKSNEYKYVYVGAARAYGLFTLEDYSRYQ